MRNRVLTLAAAAAVLFGVTATAQAQAPAQAQAQAPKPTPTPTPTPTPAPATTTNPTFELAAGYQVLRAGEVCADDLTEEICAPDRTYPFGATIDAVRNFGSLGIVAEGGWAFDSETVVPAVEELEIDEVDVKFNVWHIGGGLRYTSRKHARFWPYGQVLAGVSHDRITTDLVDDDVSRTNFMLQPGVGVTYVAGDGWGFFAQFDYRRVFLDEEVFEEVSLGSGRNDLRFVFGVRMILD